MIGALSFACVMVIVTLTALLSPLLIFVLISPHKGKKIKDGDRFSEVEKNHPHQTTGYSPCCALCMVIFIT